MKYLDKRSFVLLFASIFFVLLCAYGLFAIGFSLGRSYEQANIPLETDSVETFYATQTSVKAVATNTNNYDEGTETENGLNVSARNAVTRTFIELHLSSLNLGFPSDVWFGPGSEWHNLLNRAGIPSQNERTEHDVSLVIGFPKVKVPHGAYKGQQLNVFCSARIQLPSAKISKPDNIEIIIEPDSIYVFDSWYEVFNGFGNDMTVVTVGIIGKHNIVVPLPQHNGDNNKPVVKEIKQAGINTYDLVHENANAWIEQKPVDISIDDPYSENYNPGGGGGSSKLPEFIQFLADETGCAGSDISMVIYIIIGVFAFAFIFKILKAVFG